MSKMTTLYDRDIDFLEVMETGHRTIGENISDTLTLFFTERTHQLAGFALEAASDHLNELDVVPPSMRLAGIIKMVREQLHSTQEEFAAKVDVGLRTLQRIESGEGNLTFLNLCSLVEAAPEDVDISVVLKKTREAVAQS